MTDCLIVAAENPRGESAFTALGGKARGHLLGIVPWDGPVEHLYSRAAQLIPRIVAVARLNSDTLLGNGF